MPDIDDPRTATEPGTPSSVSRQHLGHVLGDLRRRMSHPVGDEHDLRVGQIRDRVARQRPLGEDAGEPDTEGKRQHGPGMARAPGDEAGDHGVTGDVPPA